MVQQTLFSTNHQTARTSIAAFQKTRHKQGSHKQRILAAVRESGKAGMTRDELAQQLGMLIQSVGSPVRQLVKSGELCELPTTRANEFGNQVKVLVVPECLLPDPWSGSA